MSVDARPNVSVSRSVWFTSTVAALLVALASAGCRGSNDTLPTTTVDLTAQLRPIDPLGLHLDFRQIDDSVDLDGWSVPEDVARIGRASFPTKARASLRFITEAPQAADLVIEAAWFTDNPQRASRLVARLNRQPVGNWTLEAGARVYRIQLPPEVLRAGLNTLEISAPTRRQSERSSGLAFTGIRLKGLEPDLATVAKATSLRLSPTKPFDLFVRTPSDPTLAFDVHIPSAASLMLALRASDADRDRPLPLAAGATQSLKLPVAAGQLARIRFQATDAVAIEKLRLIGQRRPESVANPSIAPRRHNIVLYVVDTLRADHLGCYGYSRPTSPNIDAFAQQAQRFTNASAQASWTRPATASILTGATPLRHGARTLRQPIAEHVPTLAQILKGAGYSTGGFVTNFNVAPQWGFARGFDTFRYFPEDEASDEVHVAASTVHRDVVRWLDERTAQLFFLYVHASDPHAPYTSAFDRAATFGFDGDREAMLAASRRLRAIQRNPRQQEPEFLKSLTAAYDAEIASTDAAFGSLIEELQRRRLYDDTIVIVTSDHGEEFFDHTGFEHGKTLYQEQLHIPLIVRIPGDRDAGREQTKLARQIDIVPTVLDAIGIQPPPSVEGRSLLAQDAADSPAESLSETRLGRRRVQAITADGYKVIRGADRNGIRTETFDLSTDPHEAHNIADERAVTTGYGLARLRGWQAQGASGAPPSVAIDDPATEERLRALGYDE